MIKEKQFNLPFNKDTERKDTKKEYQVVLESKENDKEKNEKIKKEEQLKIIREMAQGKLETGRINSFTLSVNKKMFDLNARHEDVRNLILEAFDGENPFEVDKEEYFADKENSATQDELIKRDKKVKGKKETGIIGGAHAYEKWEKMKEEEDNL